MTWLRDRSKEPFFLFLSLTIPHANNEGTRLTGDGAEVPGYGVYAGRDWPNPDKGQAAMITRMDRDVGRVLDLLAELGIAEQTLVLFSSDNGPHNEAGHNPERFRPSGPLRGMKRDLYEGGIRVPTLAWWPGTIAPGTVSSHIGYFGDLMATAVDLEGTSTPDELDSISFLPTLRGENDRQAAHPYLYWECYERGGRRALLQGNWKAVRPLWDAPVELYHLGRDEGEKENLASVHPERVESMKGIMDEAHVPSPAWRAPGK